MLRDVQTPEPEWLQGTILHIPPDAMSNHNYQVVIRPYTFGQFRLQLVAAEDTRWPSILRECCTYDRATAVATLGALVASPEPRATLAALAKPWNCDEPINGRIRLDNKPDEFSPQEFPK